MTTAAKLRSNGIMSGVIVPPVIRELVALSTGKTRLGGVNGQVCKFLNIKDLFGFLPSVNIILIQRQESRQIPPKMVKFVR